VAKLLYQLLRKRAKFDWSKKHSIAMKRFKAAFQNLPIFCLLNYACGRPIIVTIESSPDATGWAVGQDDKNGSKYVTRFGARILTE
jgi:hypothetical protein